MSSLRSYFKGIGSKYLSAVDATPRSNQHEIGSNKFTAILGVPGSSKVRFNATFLFFDPNTEEPESCADIVTYYDTRLNQPGRRPEYRLYYRDNSVTEQLREGDFCVVGALTSGELMIAVARPGTEHERRLRYLFDIEDAPVQWTIGDRISTTELNLAESGILEALGIEVSDAADDLLDALISKFGLTFPSTRAFSAFARSTCRFAPAPRDDPDGTLEAWMKHEERIFRSLERVLVEIRLKDGFVSVDDFVAFSLSVQNRRKSRVGHALENHVQAILEELKIQHTRGGRTEGNARPDFLFPGVSAYHDLAVGSPPLAMLAAKSTCKDRWRQILAEAARISRKHLLTLETAISENQTHEMRTNNVQLVVPTSVLRTYTPAQQAWLFSVKHFLDTVRGHQA